MQADLSRPLRGARWLAVWVVASLVCSCSNEPAGTRTETGRPLCEVFLVDAASASSGGEVLRFGELSAAREFLVACQVNGLQTGQKCVVEVVFRSPDGRVAGGTPEPVTFVASGGSEVVFVDFDVETSRRAPGRWAVDVEVGGREKEQGAFVLLPPDAGEREGMALHERAQEAVFNAFSNYWLLVGESPDTYMTELVSGEAKVRKLSVSTDFGASFSGNGRLPKDDSSAYFEISGVGMDFVKDHVTDADSLNGISYRGRAAFNFTVHRRYQAGEGWARWEDLSRHHSDISAAASDVGGAIWQATALLETKRLSFNDSPLTPALRYEVYCQDGSWFVISDRKDLFVNGAERGEMSPQILIVMEPKMLGELKLVKPSLDAARAVAEAAPSPREAARRLGNSVKGSSQETEYEVKRTMEALRRAR